MSERENSDKLRLAILGCGRVTENCHLPALKHLSSRIDVVAVADQDEHRRRRVSGMFDIRQTYPDLPAMLRDAGPIDIVAVCTPVKTHADAVIASLEAHKHVLVEKPLATTLDDADRIVAATQAHPDLKVMVGFNLRHHRLVKQARQMIADGIIGDIHLVRTAWTSSLRTRTNLPAWRNRRETGGGALTEIAVHHFDLVPYLTGVKITEIFAQSRHGNTDDEIAGVVMRLENGVLVSSAFSDMSGDSNEFELIGSRGRIAFSIYRYDSLVFTPTTKYEGIKRQLKQAIRELPRAWPTLRRGGDFLDTFNQQWLAMSDAVRNNRATGASAQDGRDALRAVFAAGASANTGRPVALADAPRQALPAARPASEAAPAVIDDSARPKLSAILSTRDSYETIRRTAGYLRAQTARDQIELVIVCTGADALKLNESELKGFHSHRVVEIGPFDTVAQANAAGTIAAGAPVVVFCEDHAFPDPKWAEILMNAHRGPWAAVGPAVHNANPATLVSRADFLIGYGPWAEPIKPCEPEHLPGHNSAYKRDVLLSYGQRLREMLEAETVLQWDLRRQGHRLYLEPTARLAHTNFAFWGVWTRVQFHAGRTFGGTRALDWPVWKRALYTIASPLIPLVRLRRIWGDARRLDSAHRSPAVFFTLLLGLIIDGTGQMTGYALGPGHSKFRSYEFCRAAHIPPSDRARLDASQPQVS